MQSQINILLLIGIAVFLGLSGGKIFQKLKIPQVVGYIIIGVVLGDSFFGLVRHDIIEVLTPINSFALGLIGFMIGGELKRDIFKKYGREFIVILLWEGILTFVLVTGAVTLFTGKLYLGILFGALASATAPAATVDVLWEYKSKGVLTTTILAIVALDDGLALILYGFSSAFAKTLITGENFSFLSGFVTPVKEITGAIVLGSLTGYLVYKILLKIRDRDQLLVLSIGAILLNTGLSAIFDLDLILSNMAMGVMLANQSPQKTKSAFELVQGFTPPIYVLFFVLVGARLQIGLLPKMGLLGLIYLTARTIGKFAGSYLGAVFTQAETAVRKYLGLTLFSQAGVAIGLSIAIYQSFGRFGPAGQEVGIFIINVIAATTFIVQLIGPPCVKLGIAKAGEIGKDIKEEDILNTYSVEQVMEKEVEVINKNKKLSEVVTILKNSAHLNFPVINDEQNFLGIISFENIKDVIFEKGLGDLILAGDVSINDVHNTYPAETLKSAMDKFMFESINYLPVLESEISKKFVGILHKRKIGELVKYELLGKLLKKEGPENGEIKISALLAPQNIKLELKAKDKKGIIREMITLLDTPKRIKDAGGLADILLEREAQSTTGIGDGIAIPHVRTDKVLEIMIALGRSKEGVDFQALDRKPVHFIFMIILPLEYGSEMVRIMGEISRLLKDRELRDSLKLLNSPEKIIALFREKEKKNQHG